MLPTIIHHGAASGVTGSCHRLQLDAQRALLVDCGLFQGNDVHGDDDVVRQRIDFSVKDVIALVVTHVHIDHTGRLPHLMGAAWRDLDIIVDSPLAARFTHVYRELKPYWDAETHRRLRAGRHPLSFENLTTVDSHKEHQKMVDSLARTKRPAVVLAASGMASGGRIVNYLKAMIEESRHNILFVGYQAPGTPGHNIQRYGPEGGWVELDNQRFTIRAGVETISGYSAHADQHDLVNFVKRMRYWPKQIRLVHGDQDAREALRGELLKLALERGHEVEVVLPGPA